LSFKKTQFSWHETQRSCANEIPRCNSNISTEAVAKKMLDRHVFSM
jgi:hypothetical protein